jgi:hypothetical protein
VPVTGGSVGGRSVSLKVKGEPRTRRRRSGKDRTHDTVHDSELFGILVRARSRMILTLCLPLVVVVYVPYVMHATLQ